ncbi:hypothetical protein GGG87_06150 [Streptococcus sp. zg-86]|uniref:Lipoprotein n=1 Tax=Streptococcus zhangguiae TaxID=2664091 RepID=A0A6I4RJH6_9STRE|nr:MULTISPECIES: hypothetical protein [unclassified Streptococcus]MTB64573.1 hypothetical protein [Streptococcus sp. zg-86]MTB90883.1 hypothetical protein [Streptococcus sp. zg-36]MWV56693.1 hypothetical protein [Streptococcus sp. zg-70]QTH48651.1 hypothetical protein J5M87_04845 [Streptococcus sp. zg-86]
MKKYTLLAVSCLALLTIATACSKKETQTKMTSSSSTSQVSTSSSSSQSSSSSTSEPASTADTTSAAAEALGDKNTGVTLESGQDTINYTNMILGDKGWTVVEGNYNRTDSVPYNLLQGTDGSLYRVYQNGVILDMEDTVVHQP